MLQFEIRVAKGLVSSSAKALCPDALCVVHFVNSNEHRQSNIVYATHQPIFNETYHVRMAGVTESVAIKVYDRTVEAGHLLGECVVSVGGLMRDHGSTWVDLYRAGVNSGQIHVLWKVQIPRHPMIGTNGGDTTSASSSAMTQALVNLLEKVELLETTALRLEQRQRALELNHPRQEDVIMMNGSSSSSRTPRMMEL
eukprot:PhF_6_TR9958/c0_g1_i1/m.15133